MPTAHVDFEGAEKYVSKGIVEGMMELEYINSTLKHFDVLPYI